MPDRISIERKPGWKIPRGAVFVGKPSRWRNPFDLGAFTSVEALERFRRYAQEVAERDRWWLVSIAGRDLACHCAPGEPCHADILLELANSGSYAGVRIATMGELLV